MLIHLVSLGIRAGFSVKSLHKFTTPTDTLSSFPRIPAFLFILCGQDTATLAWNGNPVDGLENIKVMETLLTGWEILR